MGGPGMGAGAAGAALAGPEYCSPYEQVYFMSEKMMSFSGDDFTIKDANNNTVYTMNSSALSMKGARTLLTAGKHPVLSMSHKMLSSGTWEVYKGKDTHNKLATIKRPSSVASKIGMGGAANQSKHNCQIFLRSNTSHSFSNPQPDMVVSGDVMGKGYYIYQGPRIIAEISRKLAQESSSVKLTGKDSYALKVSPGVDHAFMLAVVVIVDEMFHD